MMVGSDCSLIFCRSRLTNTAATRLRSSDLPGSFSTSSRVGRPMRLRPSMTPSANQTVARGTATSTSVTVKRGTAAFAGAKMRYYVKPAGQASWTSIGVVTTNSYGVASSPSIRPTSATAVMWQYVGTAAQPVVGAYSAVRYVYVS